MRPPDRTARLALAVVALVASGAGTTGCRWAGSHGSWCAPEIPSSASVRQLHESCPQSPLHDCGTQFLVAAVEAERQNDPNCAGLYYQAALSSGRCLAAGSHPETRCIATQVHNASVQGMLATACANAPFTPGECIFMTHDGQARRAAVSLHGFAWDAPDFQR